MTDQKDGPGVGCTELREFLDAAAAAHTKHVAQAEEVASRVLVAINGAVDDLIVSDGLRVGDALHASCSDQIYGRIVAMNDDGSVDLDVDDLEDLLASVESDDISKYHPTEIRLTAAQRGLGPYRVTHVRISKLEVGGWTGEPREGLAFTGAHVTLDTPGDGCFRCTKLFSVLRKP